MKPAPKPVEQPLKNKPKKPDAPAPFSLLLDTKGTLVRWMPLDNGKRGTFWLKSRPSEADVYIDGHRVGKTPLRVSIPLGLAPIPMRDGHPFKKPIQISIRRCGHKSFNFRLASVSRGAYLARLKADPNNPCRRGMLFKHTLPLKKQRCQADPIALSAARIKQTPLDWSERQRHLSLLEQASRWQDALTAIEEWRRYAPESIELILRHANLYQKQGNLQESRRVLSELVEFEPHNYNRRLIYAQELKRQGNLTEACQQYGMAAYSNPSKRDVFRQMMTLYRERYAQEEIRDIVHQCITHSVSRLPVVRDISLVLFWEDPRADVDLHIHEPNGEIVNYRRKESGQGGTLYYDITNGLGPEIYVLGTGKPGAYRISVVYYSGSPATLKGHLIALTDAGSPQEKRQRFDFTLHKSAGRNNIHITTLQIPQKR
jgi:tetratricopeptide (TPR) repeat protein